MTVNLLFDMFVTQTLIQVVILTHLISVMMEVGDWFETTASNNPLTSRIMQS